MSLRKVLALSVVVLSFAGQAAGAGRMVQASAGRPSGLSDQQWRDDIDFLAKTVAEKHRHPFDTVARADFDKAVAALRERVPSLADYEIVVGLARLVALLRDGHSRLTLPLGAGADTQSHTPTAAAKPGLTFRVLPVKLYLFSDGLFVQAAAPGRRDLVGAKVERIGAKSWEEALEAVRPAVHYDSEMWFKLVGPDYLTIPEVLAACGIVGAPGRVPLSLVKDGRSLAVELDPSDAGPGPGWVTWSDVSGGPKPLFLKNPEQAFWFELLPGGKALYAQIDSIQDGPTETLAAFAARLVAAAEAAQADRIVLDLRQNGGGNNYLARGVVLALLGSERFNRYGRLFTIIGRNTFSAAVSLVSALERWTETIFAGEPTGNTPSQYGDARRHVLPNSGLTVRLSSVYWRDADVNERRPWVAPDIAAGPAWADHAAGRDPVLEAVLAYRAPAALLDQLIEKWRWGGLSAGAAHYYKYRNSPATAAADTEAVLIALADFLAGEKRPADATGILRRAVSEYPGSVAAHLALGRRLVEQGDGTAALEPLKKALSLKPGDPVIAELIGKAEALARAKK